MTGTCFTLILTVAICQKMLMPLEEKRTATVIKEIHYWKRHKLLPEAYCDYLLSLYTEGEDVPYSVAYLPAGL